MPALLLPTGQPYSPPIPEGMDMVVSDGQVIFSWKWCCSPALGWILGGIWIPALLFINFPIYLIYSLSDGFIRVDAFLIGVIVILVLIELLGFIGLFFGLISYFQNSTHFILKSDGVEWKIGPWWNLSKIVPRMDLKNFLVRSKIVYTGKGWFVVYLIEAVNRDNREKLLFSLGAKKQADYVCGYLKNYYGTN